jgi:tetratricopeptide (TPR) repeat protein
MKRALVVVAMLAAVSAQARTTVEHWWDAYKRGVAAIGAKNYQVGIEAMQRALTEMPSENVNAHARDETIVYVPHYWIGFAKLNLGDFDGAMRELRTSEEQGAIQNSDYYARLRDAVARVNAEKARVVQSGVADVKKVADTAVSRAMSTQMDALGAGADRSDSYRAGQRKLQEAMEQLRASGSDANAYRRATDAANQARDLFSGAAEEAKRLKAARATPAVVPKQLPPKPVPQAPVAPVDVAHITVQPQPQPVPAPVVATPPPAAPIESEALVSTRIALQQYRQHKISRALASEAGKLDAQLRAHPDEKTINAVNAFLASHQTTAPLTEAAKEKPDLLPAYRAFARGEIDKSVTLLTSVIEDRPMAEAFLLRGCAKYTAAMLTAKPDLASATSDFKSALRLNRALRLDRQAFSPKMVTFFEQVKGGR